MTNHRKGRYQQINFMVHSHSWEAVSSSAIQEIPCILWNPEVHYRTNNSPSIVPTLSQMIPVHALQSHTFNIHFNIIITSKRKSFK